MDYRDVIARAATWMERRGWKYKTAKRRGYEQTLFDHTLIELDVLSELLPILTRPHHYGINETEEGILAAAILAHDLGKETKSWQIHVEEPKASRGVPHVLPDLIRNTVPEICDALELGNLGEKVRLVVALCAEFHHTRPGKGDGAILEAMLKGESSRFLTLAHLVKAIDHLCSAASADEARDCINNSLALGHHLAVSLHKVVVRGVSTAFLHYAARDAYQQRGWKPLLYFVDGTIYVADPNDHPALPTRDDVKRLLKERIESAIARDVSSLMVGSPTGNILPKPDLLDFSESRQYLERAARKVSPQSLAGKSRAARRKVVESYWKLKGRLENPTDTQVDEESKRLSVAQPEMMVFKLFKAMLDPKKVEQIGKEAESLAKALYEDTFGQDSWAALQSTSTFMPARDMAKTVDYFWSLSGTAVGRREVSEVAELPDQTRIEVLIDILNGILQTVYSKVGARSPRDTLSERMASAFVQDLLLPSGEVDVQTMARNQMLYYTQSKPFAGKETVRGIYFCPICNTPFDYAGGVKASADFIDNPQTHTNRGVAHGSFGYIRICNACYYERLLLQVLLGGRPAEVITLLPRLNLGPGKGEQLVARVRRWVDLAKSHMRGETGDLESGLSFGFTDEAARRLRARDPFSLSPEEALSLFKYRFRDDTQQRRRSEALRRLKEEFEELDALNSACGESFETWEDAVEAVIKDQIDQQEVRAIRREVFRLYETIHLICETPNLVFIPLSREVAATDDESETNRSLRRLYVALILSLVFDASVAIHKGGEPVDFRGGLGAAYVPPVPAVRSLIGYDWVPVTEAKRWLRSIGAASLLAPATGLSARSALYQILVIDPSEKIMRRIEMAGNEVRADHVNMIEHLPRFRGAKRRKEVQL